MATNKELEARIVELEGQLKELMEKVDNIKVRDRGPKSEKAMTDDDARKILMGDLKDMPHKKAAEKLGLSYGQVYSCRGGYTFKHIHKELEA